jgi:Domain of unknown function (DUF4157)
MSAGGRDRMKKPELETEVGARSDARSRWRIGREPTILRLQRTAGNRTANELVRAIPTSPAPDEVRSLRPEIRGGVEEQLGADLSRARVHTGPEAAREARREQAVAFTRGNDIFLGETVEPDDLGVLAHEAAHIVQQTTPGPHGAPDALEAEAGKVGAGAAIAIGSAPFGAVQRLWPFDEEEKKKEEFPPGWVQDTLIPDLRRNKEAWKRYADDPRTAKILRDNPHWFEGDADYKAWRADPKGWKEDPRNRPPAPSTQPEAREAAAAPAGMPGVTGETVTVTASNVNVSYDEGTGRYVVTVDGNPIAAVEANKNTPLNIDVERSGDTLGLNVSGGPHNVVPLAVRPQTETAPPVFSETAPLRVEGAARQKTLEEIGKENWERNLSPREKWEASLLGPPQTYIGDVERSLLELEQGMKMIPGVRAGVSFGQAMWGEDIIGREVDRWEAVKQGAGEFAEDVSMVLGPEDLMELGAGRGGAALEEGAAMTELRGSGGRGGMGGPPPGERPVRVAHAEPNRVTYSDVGAPSTTKGRVSSPKYEPTPRPATAPPPTKSQLRGASLNEGYTARPKQISADLDPTLARVKEERLGTRSWKEQGREFRSDTLQTFEFDKNQPAHVRGWLENERRRLAVREAEGAAASSSSLSPTERSRRLKLGSPAGTRNPPGYVLGHGSSTPAREGFSYSNSTLTTSDLNQLEEEVARRLRYRR